MKFIKENTQLFLIASLLLGLAPFSPEPHIWGKIKWIAGGANGMGAADWFDFLMHGAPWFLLIISLLLRLKSAEKKK
ncbi:hypothetical protein N9P38_01725 [Flavobacteriales bacterium]|nr:hypothetical protein [Flavobacteriales bacterium]MDB4089572.1 hypothetical protein [Flavobacteriales bacterium]